MSIPTAIWVVTEMMHLLTDMDMNTHIDRYPASDYKTNQLV